MGKYKKSGKSKEVSQLLTKQSNELITSFMATYFGHHLPKVKETVNENATHFLKALSSRINSAENTIEDKIDIVNANLKSPAFAQVLEQAIKISSVSGETDKYNVLTSLVIKRLITEGESTEALLIKLACEKLEHLNYNHLRIIALRTKIEKTRREMDDYRTEDYKNMEVKVPPELLIDDLFPNNYKCISEFDLTNLLIDRFHYYYKGIRITEDEINYLETTQCVRWSHCGDLIEDVLLPRAFAKRHKEVIINLFFRLHIGGYIFTKWPLLKKVELTPIGETLCAHVIGLIDNVDILAERFTRKKRK